MDTLGGMFQPTMSGGPTAVNSQAPFMQYGVTPPTYAQPTSLPAHPVSTANDIAGAMDRYGVSSAPTPSVGTTPPVGPLTALFPGGAIGQPMTEQPWMSDNMKKTLKGLAPLALMAATLPLTQRGTGSPPPVSAGHLNPSSPFPLPSELYARLMAARGR